MSEEVLNYIGLKLNNIPNFFECSKPKYKSAKSYDDSGLYKVYKEVPVRDIEIFLSDSDRTTEIAERYRKAIPLKTYVEKFEDKFMKLVNDTSITQIKEIDELTQRLYKETPFFVKYSQNYLWQVFYSEEDKKYFMLYPTMEGNSSALFYLIKEKLAGSKKKIFIPVCLQEPGSDILTFSENTDLENYIWLFTKEWPQTIEVTKRGNTYLNIIGKTNVYGGFKSKFKIELHSREEALEFYTLTKALFILETQTNFRENISTIITPEGKLGYCYDEKEITIDNLSSFIEKQIKAKQKMIEDFNKTMKEIKQKNEKAKEEIDKQKENYSLLEKQIVLFLDCRKTFFGKLKYFLKKGKRFKIEKIQDAPKDNKPKIEEEQEENKNYNSTIEDLVRACMDSSKAENDLKNAQADLKVTELKKLNLDKKIENAQKYINEIEQHKKSIFEFWKFANKDELTALEEGIEKEEEKPRTTLLKTYDVNTELQDFKIDCDNLVRRKLSNEEQRAVFIAKHTLSSINTLLLEDKLEKEGKLDNSIKDDLEKIIESQYEELKLNCNIDIRQEILGNIQDDFTKLKKLKANEHRENQRELYSTLKFNKKTTFDEYKEKIRDCMKYLNEAYNKLTAIAEIPIYFSIEKNETDDFDFEKYIIANINPLKIIEKSSSETPTIAMMSINSDKHLIYLTNIIFYENINKTLPSGMDEETEIIVKTNNKIDEKSKNIYVIIENSDFDVNVLKIDLIKLI